MSETSAEKSVNPLALNVAQTAKILSAVGGKSVTEDMIRSDIDAGSPTNAGQSGYLTSTATGPAQILWSDGGLGVNWAVVRIGPVGLPAGVEGDIIYHNGDRWVILNRCQRRNPDLGRWSADLGRPRKPTTGRRLRRRALL